MWRCSRGWAARAVRQRGPARARHRIDAGFSPFWSSGAGLFQQGVEETVAIGARKDLAFEKAQGLLVTTGEPRKREHFGFRVPQKKIIHLSAVLLGEHRARLLQPLNLRR